MFSYPKRFALLATSAAFAVLAVPAAARDLSTDRPDQTESPYTVDAGRTQAEFQLVSVGRETPGAGSAWQFAGLNLKRGLGRSVDLQLVFPGMESVPAGGERESGVGDLSVRLKWNMVGNDSEGIGFGLMPYATFPTGGESFTADGVEAGLIATPTAMARTAKASSPPPSDATWPGRSEGSSSWRGVPDPPSRDPTPPSSTSVSPMDSRRTPS
jgi:hypothetical protein